jgi:predicted nucleic acid-binding protein
MNTKLKIAGINPVAAKSSSFVLDSYAVLAYLEDETSGTRIKELLKDAEKEKSSLFLSIINLGEVLYITEREQGLFQAQKVLAAIDQLPLQILPAARAAVLAAAHIKAYYPLSYADSFAAAAAQQRNAILLTGDPEFRKMEKAGLIEIEWLPR